MTTRPLCPTCGESRSYRNIPEGHRTWRPCGHVESLSPEPVSEEETDVVVPEFTINEAPNDLAYLDDKAVDPPKAPEPTVEVGVIEVIEEVDPQQLVDELIKEGEAIMADGNANDALEVVMTYLRRLNRILTTGQLANSVGRETAEQLSAVINQLPDSVGGKPVDE